MGYAGIGTSYCISCLVLMFLATSGHEYVSPLLIITVQNCASVIIYTCCLSSVPAGTIKRSGRPTCCPPSPINRRSFQSNADVTPIGLAPIPRK